MLLGQEAERGRQAQETLLRELTTKAESDRKANAQEKELLQVWESFVRREVVKPLYGRAADVGSSLMDKRRFYVSFF